MTRDVLVDLGVLERAHGPLAVLALRGVLVEIGRGVRLLLDGGRLHCAAVLLGNLMAGTCLATARTS